MSSGPLPPLDATSVAQLCQYLVQLTPREAESFLRALHSHFPGINWGMAMANATAATAGGVVGRPSYRATLNYTMAAGTQSFLAIEAGASKTTRIRRVRLTGFEVSSTAAGDIAINVGRSTAPSSGGGLEVPVPDDPSDPPFSGIVRVGVVTTTPATITVGSGGNAMLVAKFDSPAAANVYRGPVIHDYVLDGGLYKPLIAPAGVANGIFFYQAAGFAGQTGTVGVEVWFTEE